MQLEGCAQKETFKHKWYRIDAKNIIKTTLLHKCTTYTIQLLL